MLAVNILMASFIHAQTVNKMENKTFNPEQQNVLRTIEKMNIAFHNKDIEGVMASYEPGAVVVFEPELPVSNEAQIREMFEEVFIVNPKFDFSGHEVFITGNTATHLSPWTMTGTAPDGSTIKQSGLSVAVLRKQPDGNWLMILDNPHGQFLMGK